MSEMLVPVGTMIVGRYRIERHLGYGGMGVVVAAWDTMLKDRVAIKFLHPDAAQRADVVARFLVEAQAARRIKSAHAVKVLEVGRTSENSQPYMVMEYLEGEDLASLVKRSGPLPPQFAVECVLQACEALAEAHRQGIIHRDLKPSNLFMARWPDGRSCVKVLDFGIAKLPGVSGSPTESMTRTSGMLGTALYASPEQLQSAKDVDARSDIWSMGITLFELLSGQFPFIADDLPGLVAQVLANPPERLDRCAPGLAPSLVATVHRCLEKQRRARFSDVAELAFALAPHAGKLGPQLAETIARVLRHTSDASMAPVVRDAVARSRLSAQAATGTSQHASVPKPRKRLFLIGAGTGIAASMLLSGAIALLRDHVMPSDTAEGQKASTGPDSSTTQPAHAALATSAALPPGASNETLSPEAPHPTLPTNDGLPTTAGPNSNTSRTTQDGAQVSEHRPARQVSEPKKPSGAAASQSTRTDDPFARRKVVVVPSAQEQQR